jgi:pilus assembly protein CpaC
MKCICLFFFSHFLSSQWCWSESLILTLGKSQRLAAAVKSSVHVGSKSLLQVSDMGSHLLLIGKKIGETHLIIGPKNYRVNIVSPAAFELYQEFKELLKNRKGLVLEVQSGKIRISGQLFRFEDWLALSDLASRRHATYDFSAHPLRDVAENAIAHFSQLAQTAGLPQPHLLSEDVLIISLPAGTDDYLQMTEKTFSSFGLGVRITPSQVKLAPLVRAQVIIAEVDHSVTQSFGLAWPESYEAKILPQSLPGDLSVTLKSLETKGLAKVLASPNLLCRSGGDADFLAGGEFPIRTGGFHGGKVRGEVAWKQHGVILRIKPLADASGAMSIDIQTEVSLLDTANSIDDIPALKTNRVHSHFDLLGKKTIALSGLIREDWGMSRQGLAGLASIPVLGALFRSQSFQQHQSELVIFVTPEVILPESANDPIRMPKGWASDAL